MTGGRYVTTENAYVKADIVTISPEIDGRVVAVGITENQAVARGDVLFLIDPEPYRIALDMTEAGLLTVRNDIQAARAEFAGVQAEIDEAAERVRFYGQQAARQRQLRQRGISAEVRLEEAEMELVASRQRVVGLREKLRKVLAELGGDPASAVELHPKYRRAEAAREMAMFDLNRTEIRAPVAGLVSRMRLQVGEWVEEGKPTFSIIDPASVWVEANLKETQLEAVAVGQPVRIEVDAYAGQVWQGEIASISAATGAEFALIPPQNATGNWVKVVQRLPVRIRVPADQAEQALRAGMTVSVAIDTGRESKLANLVKGAVAAVGGRD
jgi:membrane fusion protein (multidrug efflux system)